MTELEILYDYAYNRDIQIYSFLVSAAKKAVSISIEDTRALAVNYPAIETRAEEKCIIAEEIGHYETDAFYYLAPDTNSGNAQANRRRAEYKAQVWSIKNLLPPDKLQSALNICANDYELAEYLDIPPDYLKKAFEYYASAGVTFNTPDI